MNLRIYDINYRKLIRQLTPIDLHAFVDYIAILEALFSPIIALYNGLIYFRQSILYRLSITPQVCYLEKMLNDRYDPLLRRIFIAPPQRFNEIYVYQEEEEKPVMLYQESESLPVFLYADSETGATTADFIVNIPNELVINENEFDALLGMYKLPDKVHAINRL